MVSERSREGVTDSGFCLRISGNTPSIFFPVVPGSRARGLCAPLAFQLSPALSPQKQLFDHNGNKADHEKQKNNGYKFL
jgi:hypothetical protein